MSDLHELGICDGKGVSLLAWPVFCAFRKQKAAPDLCSDQDCKCSTDATDLMDALAFVL